MAGSKKTITTTGKAAINLHSFFSPADGHHDTAVTGSPEIIIIDSDEEETAARPNLKRSICNLQGHQPKHRQTKRSKATGKQNDSAPFGTPTLLLEPPILGPSDKAASSSSSISLVHNDKPTGHLSYVRHVHASDQPGLEASIATSRSDLTLAVTDEWNMGDDEQGLQDFDEPEDTLDEFGSVLGTSSDIDSCPVCGKRFLNLLVSKLQEHINECLDKSAAQVSQNQTRCHSSSRRDTSESSSALSSLLSTQNNAFSVLMSSHKENEAWREAEIAEKTNVKTNRGRRKAPFYKVLQGMPIAVDAFRYGKIPEVTAYFLTHAHSDHYTNLSSSWKSGPIYCSQVTAKLIVHMLSVDPKWVHPLPMDEDVVIPNTGGVHVTLIEANHCPGSCLFLFEGPQTVNAGDSVFKSTFVGSNRMFRYLHCGDFRASPRHIQHPAVKGKRVDHVYLDTTYLDPKYCFPPQPQVISACAELAARINTGSNDSESRRGETKQKTMDDLFPDLGSGYNHAKPERRVLFVIGTYSVGKERIVSAVAKRLQAKIYCDGRKAAIIHCQSDLALESMLTENPLEATVHVVPLGMISPDKLRLYANRWKEGFDKIVGFRPTGWTYTPSAGTNPHPTISSVITRSRQQTFTWSHLKHVKGSSVDVQVYAVPYSEHSSFFELTCFALSLDWDKMIATVNVGSDKSRAKMNKWFERWEKERKNRKDVVDHRNVDYW